MSDGKGWLSCLTAVGLMSVFAHGQAASFNDTSARRPNIIVIVADDLGYADLGCQGSREVLTPNIDTLAANGVRFTSGYVSCPVCSPTRAGLNTGRYQQRFGHEFNPSPPARVEPNFGLPLSEKLMPACLKEAGYATGMVGKWHLGYRPEFHPMRRGFDDYFGFLGGSHSYIDANADARNLIYRGTTAVDEREYLTEAFTREAIAYIDRHAKEPFYLYLTYNAVHSPMQTPEKYLQRFPSVTEPRRRAMLGMLAAMDDGVGALLKKLREHGIEENTLVFFISDNGGPTRDNGSRNDPLSGFKGQVLEGGIRVPFIIQWKGRLPAGKLYDQPVISLDVLPTALAAAGAAVPADHKLDGANLIPFLTGDRKEPPHETLFWRFGSSLAVRRGSYKLDIIGGGPPQLFDLAADVGEKNDLVAQKPEIARELHDALKAWDATLVPPRWGGARANRTTAPATTRPGGA